MRLRLLRRKMVCLEKVAGLCNSGAMFELINPAEGSLSYWDLSTAFGSDPMAALAYISSGTYDYRSSSPMTIAPLFSTTCSQKVASCGN